MVAVFGEQETTVPELCDRRDDHVHRRNTSVLPQQVCTVLSPLILPQRDLQSFTHVIEGTGEREITRGL